MGDLIAFVGSTSGATYFPDQVKRDDIEGYPIEMLVFKPPCFQQAPYKVAVQQGAGMVVTKSDSRTEYACSVFLKWFTEDERNIKFSIDSGYMPVKKTANQVDKVLDATAKMDQTNSVKKFEKTLPVSIETVNEYELYTNKAFNGGTKARNVLETSMQGQAKKDSAEVDKLVSEGMGLSLIHSSGDYLKCKALSKRKMRSGPNRHDAEKESNITAFILYRRDKYTIS